MTSKTIKTISSGLAAIALSLTSGVAFADGMAKGSLKDVPVAEAKRDLTITGNFGVTTEYVFRGISQSAEKPTVQGGVDVAYKMFYAGLWASGVDFGDDLNRDVAHVEIDYYFGVKPVVGRFNFDLGVIYYTYPRARDGAPFTNREFDYVELKAGVTTEAWKDGTLGVTVFYSPNYTNDTGSVVTIEGSVSQVLPKMRDIVPTFSALIGYQAGDDARFANIVAGGDDNYLYWNAGLTLGFGDRFSLDFRYWDTNISNTNSFCTGQTFQCDERFVGTAKVTF